jgi:hypothetical protein
VVQRLRLPSVVKMKDVDVITAGTGCRGGSARMWSEMGASAAHRVGWDAGLHAACVGCRRRKLHLANVASRAGMDAGCALGASLGMRQAWARE